jgi:enolase-phosphatase E1
VNATRIACRAVLVDIEGTTSAIAFVHEVLFPYADEHLDAYVAAHREEPAVAQAMREAAQLAGEEPDVDDATILAYLHRWIAEDRKATPLKALQGLIWAEGYAGTSLRGHVYPDAADGLRRWHAAGVTLHVYSSGSVEAQRVLFGHSDQGDLSPLFSSYFDTTTGPKRERASYDAIARAIAS